MLVLPINPGTSATWRSMLELSQKKVETSPLGKCLFITQINVSGRGTNEQEKGTKTNCKNIWTHTLYDVHKMLTM